MRGAIAAAEVRGAMFSSPLSLGLRRSPVDIEN